MKIMSTKSARGLSLSAYVRSDAVSLLTRQILETVSYTITLAYNTRSGFPFSTYGENLFITIQNMAITLMILFYTLPKGSSYSSLSGPTPLSSPRQTSQRNRVLVGAAIMIVSCLFLWSKTLCSQTTSKPWMVLVN